MQDAREGGAVPAWRPPGAPPTALLRHFRDPDVTLLHTGARSRVWRLDPPDAAPVVVKMCRDPGAAEREFGLLRLFHDRYDGIEGVRVPRAIVLVEEERTVVAEYLPLITVRRLGSVQELVRSGGRSRGRLLALLETGGRWLGRLHTDQVLAGLLQGLAVRAPRSASSTGRLLEAALEAGLPEPIARDAESLLASIGDGAVHRCATHGDFGTANIAATGDALALVDLAEATLDIGTHEVARTWTRLLAVPALTPRVELDRARGRFLNAYGGQPPGESWQRWRTWALLELLAESQPGGWRRTLWSRVIRSRCQRELLRVLRNS
jgi:hypothetical protein